MKILISRLRRNVVPGLTLTALLATTTLYSQTPVPAPVAAAQIEPAKLSAEDLEDLVGPIALYPDALVALILPAATVPSDITLAARYLREYGDEADVAGQPWDASVRSLAFYPDVLEWMDENLEWTIALGEAFVVQPADVMTVVQELRLAAKENGNLRNTPQQTVVVEEVVQQEVVQEVIRIVPADPEVIYVPVYDPEVVYVETYRPNYTPFITFGIGLAVGSWLNYDCDWRYRDIYYGDGCGWNNRDRWNNRGRYDRDDNVNVITNVNNTNINNITNVVNNNRGNRWQANAASRRFYEQRRSQNIGNTRIARANAAIRPADARRAQNRAERAALAANRPARVARPDRLKAITKNTAAQRAKNARVAANKRQELSTAQRANNARAAANRLSPADQTKRNGNNQTASKLANRPKPASVAPKVSAQSDRQNAKKADAKAANARKTADTPLRKPGVAPVDRGNAASAATARKSNNAQNKLKTDAPRQNAGVNKPSSAPKISQQRVQKPQTQASKSQQQQRQQQVKKAQQPSPQKKQASKQQPQQQRQQQVQRTQQSSPQKKQASAPKVSQQRVQKPQAQASRPQQQQQQQRQQQQRQQQRQQQQRQQQVQRAQQPSPQKKQAKQQQSRPQQAQQQARPKQQKSQQVRQQSAPRKQSAQKQGGGGNKKQSSDNEKKKKKG